MKRRHVLPLLGAAVAWPFAGRAQQSAGMRRVGYLALSARPPDGGPPPALRDGLRAHGHVEGRNVEFLSRFAEAQFERLPVLARELVSSAPDLIVATGSPAAEALRDATSRIPIVFALAGDAVAMKLIDGLARPGANITGITEPAADLSAKRLELFKEAVPAARRIAVFWNPRNRPMTLRYREIDMAAAILNVEVRPQAVQAVADYDAAFAALRQWRPDGLFVITDLFTTVTRKRLLDFAAELRIPTLYELGSFVREGGFMSYGARVEDIYRRAAALVDAILKGAAPATLPAEQPDRFYLTVNLKTARALGIDVAPTLIARADEVIE